MKRIYIYANTVGLLVLWSIAPLQVYADENDPPSSVARIGYIDGAVSIQPAGTQDWVQAPINRPLTTGDVVWSDEGGRSELQLDGSTVRIADSTELTILNLGSDVTQLQLSSGTLVLRVRRLDDRETYEIDTPNLAFSVLRPGVYRLSVDSAGNTAVTVRSGQGEVSGGGSAYSVYAGDADLFTGTDQLAAQALSDNINPDAFESWCGERDARWEHSVSARYVSRDIIGYQDLDDQGSWRSSPDYGYVWYPNRVEAGWAPYHVGHWSYIAPWGYTWVDDQPWGFAPFHYGRWLWTDRGWGWIPAPPALEGASYVRPIYAPALVAWVGASVGASVAWFALGPREVYVPSYPVSASYVRNINVSNTRVTNTVVTNVYNTTIINNKTVNVTYVNRAAPGAIATTSAQAFSTAQPVAKNRASVDARSFVNAPTRSLAPAIVPTRQAVLGAAQVANVKPPASIATRPAVARTAPPAPPPTIDRRLEAIKNNGGNPLSPVQAREIQPERTGEMAPIRIVPRAAPVSVVRDAPKANSPLAAGNQHPPAHVAAPTEMTVSKPMPAAVHARELPPPPKPASPSIADSILQREHLQQQQQLVAQQAQERLRMQQQQEHEHQQAAAQQQADAAKKQAQDRQKLAAQAEAARNQALEQQRQTQQRADEARSQALERQHQLQTQQMQQRHIEEQQQLQTKQREQQKDQDPWRNGNPGQPVKRP